MTKTEIGTIGVFTSGGDAPGMNAAIRAVVRAACYYRKETVGILRGYRGMIEGEFQKMGPRSVQEYKGHTGRVRTPRFELAEIWQP